jgi:RimJ/RimL family protein N-acetyltransferase
MFLPEAWGFGYVAEACAAALDWFAGVLPGEPVVLTTQTANDRSMRLAAKLGFTESPGWARGARGRGRAGWRSLRVA